MTALQLIKLYADKLLAENYSSVSGVQMAIRTSKGFLITKPDLDLSNVTEQDYTITDNAAPYDGIFANSKVNAIFVAKTPAVAKVSGSVKYLPPVLDDMAQIVGAKAHVVTLDKAAPRLKRSNAIITPDGLTVAVGSTLFEAFVAVTVLEKSAFVYDRATKLGGAKSVSSFDAWLMHLIYTKKYSQAEKGNKTAEMTIDE